MPAKAIIEHIQLARGNIGSPPNTAGTRLGIIAELLDEGQSLPFVLGR